MIADGEPESVRQDPRVVAAYLGGGSETAETGSQGAPAADRAAAGPAEDRGAG